MTWTTFEYLQTFCWTTTAIITIARVAIDVRTWYRKRKDENARVFDTGANQQDEHTPILPSIQPPSPIYARPSGESRCLGGGIRLEDLEEEEDRVVRL
ncbi:hypothetical protein ASPCADRAFT_2997 [Aspergillus carbonarius ITEM 5010]|uniref:Uncharacterized protein n=1 Tax=Aspergillus carbonarius (strain ITEM 5010) TaxID=602072 RepID=A0A1R3RTX9_ASPC5|nr:hypothetical protein ASPCADRAFT_2997 [Aspergillus carbonarius ITEM 5010]